MSDGSDKTVRRTGCRKVPSGTTHIPINVQPDRGRYIACVTIGRCEEVDGFPVKEYVIYLASGQVLGKFTSHRSTALRIAGGMNLRWQSVLHYKRIVW